MPTRTKRRGKIRWRGQVKIAGKIVASKWFGSGREEKQAAILWEAEQKKILKEQQARQIPTDCLTVLGWANEYLNFAKARYAEKTYREKRDGFKRFIKAVQVEEPGMITPAVAMGFLSDQFKNRSGYSANKERKNLAAAWEWGRKYIDGFAQVNPFRAVDKFPEIRQPRYVPPIGDFDKVYAVAEGQDKVMLLACLHLAARRGELFRLLWSDVANGQICLTTRKTRTGSPKRAWLPMTKELAEAMEWWRQNRPYKTDHVFVMLAGQTPGEPFRQRRHFMKTICEKADVKPFGFHAIRHMTASYLYQIGKPLSLIQRILRHDSPGTTERYLNSLGFKADDIGRAVEELSSRKKEPERKAGKVIPFPKKKTPRAANS
jgi:integrase